MRALNYEPVATPAVGTDFSFTLSSRDDVCVRTISATLTTGSDGGTEQPSLELVTQNGDVVAQFSFDNSIGASAIAYFQWDSSANAANNFFTTATGVSVTTPMANLWIPPMWSWRVLTANLQTDDQWTGIFVTYYKHDVAYDADLAPFASGLGA
jgi:hypothetical protein